MRIIAFTGAGISKASGISTFMERPEVREKLYRSFAKQNPESYRETIHTLKNSVRNAKVNDAHQALFDYDIEIITMNIDGLHEKAGSPVIALHGTLPDDEALAYCDQLYNLPVLYGDPAPNYAKAYELVGSMHTADVFLVIGASHHTAIANDLRNLAHSRGARIIEIQEQAKTQTRELLKSLQ